MKVMIIILSFSWISAFADLNIGEQTYLDSLNTGDDFSIDLDSATQTPIKKYDKEKDLSAKARNLKVKNDYLLDDADVLLDVKDLPKEDPEVVEKRVDNAKRNKAAKDFMANNDIYE